VSSSLSTDNIREIYLANVSDIIENVYTFSAFTASTKLTLTACTLTEFNSSLPNTLVRFYIYNNYAPSTQYFNFNPTTNLALLPSFVELIISNTDMSGFTYDFSGSSSLQTLQLTSNNSLTNLNMTVPTGSSFFQFWVFGNTSLSALTVNNNLSDCINLDDIRVYGNTSLTDWTYTLPVPADYVQLNSNRIRNFDIDLSANTNLTTLNLTSNLVLSSFTNSISGCTSLTSLRLDNNNLTTLPPIFPNSIQTLRLESNDITGYTSNFPTSCVYFDMSDSVASLQTVPQWSVDLTGATSLQTFNLNSVGLSGWTTQFPSSIKTISFRNNLLTDFDFNYTTGATSIDLYFNQLTGTTNLSGHTSLTGLTIGSNNFTDSSPILGGDFPPTLRTFDIWGSPLLKVCTK
jgi:Leucine-rich repeat (LRR) protein